MTARRYLFAVVDAGGNVPPELGAARRLVERGHHVTVIGEDSIADEVRATGAALLRWARAPNRPDRRPENDPVRDWEFTFPWQIVGRLLDRQLVGPAAAYAADLRAAIAQARPDLVVCSMFCLGGMVAAEAEGVPFDVVLPNIYLLPAASLPPYGLGLRPGRGAPGRLRDRVLRTLGEWAWDAKGRRGLNALRARYGLPPLDHLFDQLRRARRQLVLTSAEFDFPWNPPAGVRYVGAVLDDPVWTGEAWSPPPGAAPLVLVALSSTFQDQVGTLQRVLDGLAGEPVRVLVTTGPALDVSALRAPGNATIVASAPHTQVLAHAALVVTHGGHGTVMKALAAGVPLLILPHGRDQTDNAVRVALRGAGLTVKRTAAAAAIAHAARRLLTEPAYRTAAERMGEIIRRDADSGALVRELEGVPPRAAGLPAQAR